MIILQNIKSLKGITAKIDSTQFKSISSKIDTLINHIDSSNISNVPSISINNFSSSCEDSMYILSWILRYLVAPALIVLISVWLTKYISKRREYNRIKSLNSFVNVWLNNIVSGINEQIEILKSLKETFVDIDYSEQRQFNYVNVDIKRLIDIPSEDLYKLFIIIRKGDGSEKSQNLYDLFFALSSADKIITDYRDKTAGINKNLVEMSDDAFKKYRMLLPIEAGYGSFHIQEEKKNRPLYKLSILFKTCLEYGKYCEQRQKEMEEDKEIKNHKKIINSYCQKLAKLCSENLHIGDDYLHQLLKLNNDVSQAIFQYTSYYEKLGKSYDIMITQLEEIRNLIIKNQKYFNDLSLLPKFKFKE